MFFSKHFILLVVKAFASLDARMAGVSVPVHGTGSTGADASVFRHLMDGDENVCMNSCHLQQNIVATLSTQIAQIANGSPIPAASLYFPWLLYMMTLTRPPVRPLPVHDYLPTPRAMLWWTVRSISGH